MPRIVDHEERRHELAQAVWRVILRDGVQHASVRSVAREAGRSPGSLRHYFGTQAELLTFAMRLVNERVRARIIALPTSGPLVDDVVRRCVEVLPLDAERRAEAEVWLALTGASLTDPSLGAIRREADDGMRELCGNLLDAMREVGALDPARSAELETERLRALIDGLALHLLFDGDQAHAEVEVIVRRHIEELLS